MTAIEQLCTFQRDSWCARVAEDDTVHVWEDERMRHGHHVWRHDPKDAPRLLAWLNRAPEPSAYERGYDAGLRAATRPAEDAGA